MSRTEENNHLKATHNLQKAAAAFKENTEHTGRHLQLKAVLEGFAESVTDLQSSALALERFYTDELANTSASPVSPKEQVQQALDGMHQAADYLAKSAAALERSLNEGEGLLPRADY